MRTSASGIFLASSSCEESDNRVKLRLEHTEKTAAQLIDNGVVLETKFHSRESERVELDWKIWVWVWEKKEEKERYLLEQLCS